MPNFGGAPSCAVCSQNVYFAEKIHAMNTVFHKKCLKCAECGKILDPSAVNDHDDKPYCRVCHSKNFGIKGYGYAAGGSGLCTDGKQIVVVPKIQSSTNGTGNGSGNGEPAQSAPRWGGGGEKCHHCQKTVYHNERLDCNNHVFHKLCLKCFECGKLMEKGHVNVHGENIYCRGCYTRWYGTKGFVAGTSMHAS